MATYHPISYGPEFTTSSHYRPSPSHGSQIEMFPWPQGPKQAQAEYSSLSHGIDDAASIEKPPTTNNANDKHLHWWKPLAWMVTLAILGLGFGIAHHLFYNSLNKKPVTDFDQAWANNIGSGAAFGLKTSCTLVVVLACQEVLWYTVRNAPIRISTLDDMFTLLSNPFAFKFNTVRSATLLSVLAAFAWLIPLSTILSPGTLTVQPHTTGNTAQCLASKFPGDVSTMYTITPHSSHVGLANLAVQKLASQVLSDGVSSDFRSPCGSNCTYHQTFFGPAIDCKDTSNPWNASEYESMQAVFFFNASVDFTAGFDTGSRAMGLDLFYRDSMDVVTTSDAGLPFRFLKCQAYNASYDVTTNFSNGRAIFESKVDITTPLPWRDVTTGRALEAAENVTQANYQSLVYEVFKKLVGGASGSPTTQTILADTEILSTNLVSNAQMLSGRDGWQLKQDLAIGIPELLRNLTISTIAFNTANETLECTSSRTFQAYRYSPRWLLVPYALALLASILASIAAFFVLQKTGMRSGETFSQILVTTRNADLDRLTFGNSLSSVGETALRKKKIRLGQLLQQPGGAIADQDTQHAAFGTGNSVLELRRGVRYR